MKLHYLNKCDWIEPRRRREDLWPQCLIYLNYLRLCRKYLPREMFEVGLAETGFDALSMPGRKNYDIILLDQGVPVMLVFAMEDLGLKTKARQAGICNYMVKTYRYWPARRTGYGRTSRSNPLDHDASGADHSGPDAASGKISLLGSAAIAYRRGEHRWRSFWA